MQADKPAVDKDGWFETGDVATIDQHGFMAVRRPLPMNWVLCYGSKSMHPNPCAARCRLWTGRRT